MNDTDPKIAKLVRDFHLRLTPYQRMQIASAMFDSARAIVLSSLDPAIVSDRRARRLALARRLYGRELPEAALAAFAEHVGGGAVASNL